MQICTSLPRQITTPASHHSVFCRPDALPVCKMAMKNVVFNRIWLWKKFRKFNTLLLYVLYAVCMTCCVWHPDRIMAGCSIVSACFVCVCVCLFVCLSVCLSMLWKKNGLNCFSGIGWPRSSWMTGCWTDCCCFCYLSKCLFIQQSFNRVLIVLPAVLSKSWTCICLCAKTAHLLVCYPRRVLPFTHILSLWLLYVIQQSVNFFPFLTFNSIFLTLPSSPVVFFCNLAPILLWPASRSYTIQFLIHASFCVSAESERYFQPYRSRDRAVAERVRRLAESQLHCIVNSSLLLPIFLIPLSSQPSGLSIKVQAN